MAIDAAMLIPGHINSDSSSLDVDTFEIELGSSAPFFVVCRKTPICK